MGAKDSKPSCISYEEAVKRVTDSELRRIKDAFKRSAGTSGSVLSKCAFMQDVLGDGVPSVVADWLYTACGGTAKGIAFKELLCGLVLLTKGTQDEKIKFLWTLYCNESGTHILKQEFQKAIQIETTYQSNATNSISNTTNCSNNNNNNQSVVNRNNQQQQLHWNRFQVSLFGQSDRVTFEQFKSWIQMHRGATALSKWLLQDACVNLSSELETPTFYQSLAGVTHLEEQDIGDLEKVFWLLKGAAVTGQLDLESLGPLVSPPVPKAALGGVFLAFDENHDGHIDFKELCCGVSAACRGPSVERSKFCFKVFDIDRDGVLSFVEIRQMIDILLSVAREANGTVYRNLNHDRVLAELYRRATKGNGSKEKASEPERAPLDSVCAANIPEFKFTQEDFLIWSIESSSNLVQPFLDLLFEVCHIVLGLRPQCRHLEGDIVRGWLSREVRRGYKVGQFWYLISSDWWQHWSQYTQLSSPSSSCVHCKTTGTSYANNRANASVGGAHSLMPNGVGGTSAGTVDEAMICDESFTSNSTESMGDLLGAGDSSSLGSGSSGISYGRHAGSAPGPIDNSCLIAPNIYKQIPTLTGEGGRLKRDLTLVQHRDFELVPDSLWKALAQWYGGPLPLPRQVIQPHSIGDVELELYPLNLRILRHQNQPAQHQQQHGQMAGSSAWASMSGGYGALTTGSYPTTVSSVPAVLHPPKKYLAYTAAFSRLATIKQVAEFLCQRLKLKPEDIRLWHLVPTPTGISEFPYLLEEDQLTLHELSIGDTDQILLEIRNKDLTWPEELGSLALSQGTGGTSMDRRGTIASIQSQHPPGATGLHNLGNTCFMNAALQVLFNTQPLTQYFIQKKHLYELNTTNKMGTKGQLVLRYAELLRDVWTASTRSIAPLKLRFCVTKHAPQFSGGGQHDSQELLDWLLDSLHEDLNRVMEKPYTELKDSDGRSDVIVATEAWSQHHARNQSIIVDLFYGQLKSKVTCQGCGRDSVRFDPFSLLSLPLPVENYTYCEVLVMLLDGSVPVKYGLRMNSEMKYWDLKKHLSELCSLEPDQMLICELSNSQIRLILPNEIRIKPSTACELYAYELPKVDSVLRSRAGSELGINIEKGLKDIQRNQALLIPSLDPHQLTTSSINTTISSTSSSASSSSTATTDDTTAITGRKPGSATGGGSKPLTNGVLYNGVAAGGGGVDGGGSNGATVANRRTSATSKVSRCFGNTLCMPPNMLCFKHIPEISTSPESTFVYGAGQYSELTGYGSNGYGNVNSVISNQKLHTHTSATQQPSKDPNRSKTISTTNLLNNADNGWSSGNGVGCDLSNAHHLHHPYECTDCDNIYMGEDMPPYGDPQQGDAISLSAISKRPHGFAGGTTGLRKTNYLIAVHRKLSRQDTYFLSHHKSKPGLFGVPLLIPCYDGVTNKELYCSVWLQVARLLSPLPPTPPDQSNHATDCDDSLGYDFPFTLRAVGSGGRMCALCPWSRFCRGCEIPCNDEPLLQGLICSAPGSTSNSSTPNLSSREQTPTLRRKGYAASSSGSSSLDGASNQQQQPSSMGTLPTTTSASPIASLQSSINTRSIQIAIDWDPTALHLRYQSTRERLWTVHESVAICRKQQTEPVDLDHCLRAFTSEEKLEQWYHCSHCKQKKPATKKLQIWKLPPILIVHLKRFNYVSGKWVKSQKVVNFPYEGFDPTPYLASVPQETILRHRDLLEGLSAVPRGDGRNRDCHEEFVEFDREMSMIDEASDEISLSSLRLNGVRDGEGGGDSDDCGNSDRRQDELDGKPRSSIITPAVVGFNHVSSPRQLTDGEVLGGGSSSSVGNESTTASSSVRIKSACSVRSSDSARRQRLVSTSLTKTPIIDGELTDYHKHHLKPDCDAFELKYQLYAAVCHSGMLNGGHYISYAANPNGSWYCYNDSSCREIPTRPKIDPSTAYLLFYERRDLEYGPYLPKVDGRQLPSEGLLDIDDSDNDLKKMCSLM